MHKNNFKKTIHLSEISEKYIAICFTETEYPLMVALNMENIFSFPMAKLKKKSEGKRNPYKNKISSGSGYFTVVMTIKTSPFSLHRTLLCKGSLLLYHCNIPPHFRN